VGELNILSLLDILEDELEKGVNLPFATRALIDREKCLDIIKDIRLSLPEEIKQAEWIRKERQRIILDAQKEAETITKEAEQRIKSLVDENEITQSAYRQSREILESAQESAKEIRLGAKEYADAILEDVEGYLAEKLDILRANRQELKTAKR
jgi:vacuolar-type H+-ATPase subunit H